MRCLCLLLVLSFTAAPTAGFALDADPPRPRDPRVRPADERMAALLLDGLSRSATLRDIVAEIERHDVIVYLQMDRSIGSRLAGSLTWLTTAGRVRYVRASINPDLSPDAQLAAVGHELQHVLEVIGHPEVRDALALLNLYRRIGIQNMAGPDTWDTEAAQRAGYVVRRELKEWPAGRAADALAQVAPFDGLAEYPRTLASRLR